MRRGLFHAHATTKVEKSICGDTFHSTPLHLQISRDKSHTSCKAGKGQGSYGVTQTRNSWLEIVSSNITIKSGDDYDDSIKTRAVRISAPVIDRVSKSSGLAETAIEDFEILKAKLSDSSRIGFIKNWVMRFFSTSNQAAVIAC